MTDIDQEWDGFFTISHISRLTGIPPRTLYEWRARDIIRPSLVITEGKHVEEGYSYATVTIVRLLRWMRNYKVDFRSVSNAFLHLYARLGPPSRRWTGETVYFVGRHIFVDGQDGLPTSDAAKGGQYVMTKLFGELFSDVGEIAEGESMLVPQEFRKQVEINPKVMGGEPVLRGTRIPTSNLGSLRKSGCSVSSIVRMYSPIQKAKIESGIAYEEYLDSQAA